MVVLDIDVSIDKTTSVIDVSIDVSIDAKNVNIDVNTDAKTSILTVVKNKIIIYY